MRKPRGRKPGSELEEIRNQLGAIFYRRYLPWLQKRKKRYGLKGWPAIREADWWQGSPSERARRMAIRCLGRYGVLVDNRKVPLFPMMDEGHLRNLLSRYR